MSDPVEIQRLLSECLLHMTAENWRDVIATFNKISIESGRDPADAWKLSLFRSGQVAGAEAMDSFLNENFPKAGTPCWQTLYGWASKDPHAALDWVKKAEATGHPSSPGHYGAIISGTALSDPQAALKLLEEIPAAMRKNCAGNLVWNVVQNGGTPALDSVLKYASTLDATDSDNKKLADELFYETSEKLLWQADHARDVQQGCDVVLKLAQYGRDPNELTGALIRKYRWYAMSEKLNILETVRTGISGTELELPSLASAVMNTMSGDGDRVAVREWIDKHPDSPLIPHLQSRLPSGP
ncbi:hypothetical protein [Haloferula sp. BvORR071]|uniref:hypothetical protein n=1 Tax=Haloferula sp. BvORR071 TaxID=1396141 RepID=UPI000555B1F8|nr:hypothetical protein [Haloferula sp. BvORR071]